MVLMKLLFAISLSIFQDVFAMEYTKFSNTWSEEDCGPMINMIMPISGGLEKCEEECNADISCTAFEYANTTFNDNTDCCILRSCPLPVPKPNVAQAEWHNGNFNYSGYASSYPFYAGKLIKRKHKVTGDVTVLDKKTFLISNMTFDGKGPKTYFHVGTGKININFATMMQIVPYNDTCISNGTDFNCGCDRAQCPKWKIPAMGHNGIPKRDVILTIPGNVTFTDIEWLSLYCRRFKVSFGDITFRTGPTTVPPESVCENKWPNRRCHSRRFMRNCKRSKRIQNNCNLGCGLCCGNIASEKQCEDRKKQCHRTQISQFCKKTCNVDPCSKSRIDFSSIIG